MRVEHVRADRHGGKQTHRHPESDGPQGHQDDDDLRVCLQAAYTGEGGQAEQDPAAAGAIFMTKLPYWNDHQGITMSVQDSVSSNYCTCALVGRLLQPSNQRRLHLFVIRRLNFYPFV